MSQQYCRLLRHYRYSFFIITSIEKKDRLSLGGWTVASVYIAVTKRTMSNEQWDRQSVHGAHSCRLSKVVLIDSLVQITTVETTGTTNRKHSSVL